MIMQLARRMKASSPPEWPFGAGIDMTFSFSQIELIEQRRRVVKITWPATLHNYSVSFSPSFLAISYRNQLLSRLFPLAT